MRRDRATWEEYDARMGKIGLERRWKSENLGYKAVMGGVNDAGRARHTLLLSDVYRKNEMEK